MEVFEKISIPEKRELGKNCVLKVVFLRHAHKLQFDPHEEGHISWSGLSEKGKVASQELGESMSTEEALKAYVSRLGRTHETAENYILGANEKGQGHILKTRTRSQLDAPYFSPEFIKTYRARFKQKPEDYESLSDDEKEIIVEDMEAPAVDYWLDLWDKKFDEETESAKEVAERMAYYFARFDKLVGKLKPGSQVELLNFTHRTMTEPFLVSCLNPSVKDLHELGGPLELLEGFEIVISTDCNGNRNYKVMLRDEEYGIDMNKIQEFKDAYVERTKKD